MDRCQINEDFLLQQLQDPHSIVFTTGLPRVHQMFLQCPQIEEAVEAAANAAYTGGGSGGGGNGGGGNNGGGGSSGCTSLTDDNIVKGAGINDSTNRVPANPYFCGYPGAPFGATRTYKGEEIIGGCSWNFEAALGKHGLNPISFRWVSYNGISCSGSCSDGYVCGTAQVPGANRIIEGTCGKLLGYWSTSQICSIDALPTRTDPSLPVIQCLGLGQLYKCDNGISTCYNDHVGSDCCGCVDWGNTTRTSGIKIGQGWDLIQNGSYTRPCQNINTKWTSTVLCQIIWVKELCPSIYAYPFDDKSSSFICTSTESHTKPLDGGSPTINSLNYDIIFCPDSTKTARSKIPIKPSVIGYRIITFYNYCPYDVWPALTGGSVSKDDCGANPAMCTKGSTCINTQTGHSYCFWDNPEPVSGIGAGTYHLAPGGTSVEFHIPTDTPYGGTKRVWSGAMTGRLGCSDTGTAPCLVGDCGLTPSGATGCKPAKGFNQPATEVELTAEDVDHYDGEGINGVTVPMMIMPGVIVIDT